MRFMPHSFSVPSRYEDLSAVKHGSSFLRRLHWAERLMRECNIYLFKYIYISLSWVRLHFAPESDRHGPLFHSSLISPRKNILGA